MSPASAEDNKAKFEEQKRLVTKYKELIAERLSQLRALALSEREADPKLQETGEAGKC